MEEATRTRRPLIAGIRPGGASRFQFTIFGDRSSRFPPLTMEMTLPELNAWLRDTGSPPAGPVNRQLPLLRLVE